MSYKIILINNGVLTKIIFFTKDEVWEKTSEKRLAERQRLITRLEHVTKKNGRAHQRLLHQTGFCVTL